MIYMDFPLLDFFMSRYRSDYQYETIYSVLVTNALSLSHTSAIDLDGKVGQSKKVAHNVHQLLWWRLGVEHSTIIHKMAYIMSLTLYSLESIKKAVT